MSWQGWRDGHFYGRWTSKKYFVQLLLEGVKLHKTYFHAFFFKFVCLDTQTKKGNSVNRDLPPTSSEANTTILYIYILDIDSHCPYLLLDNCNGNRIRNRKPE